MKRGNERNGKAGKIAGAVFLLALFVWILFAAKQKSPETISATEFKLNTVVTITIYDSGDERVLEGAMELCDHYEKMFSRTLSESEISRLNSGGLERTENGYLLSEETYRLIEKGMEYSALSDGAFDLTIEPVSSLWNFTGEEKVLPDQELLSERLKLVGYEKVKLQEDAERSKYELQFQQEGMGLELGAIAKGYIADRMKEYLIEQGVTSAMIDLGGNVLCVGNRPDGQPFRVGVRKPFEDPEETALIVEVSDRSVVSSGVYERCFEKDGKLYHHILDPDTGYPYENGLLSVTIFSDQSVDGDGLSTACFGLGLEKGMELVEQMDDVQAVFITEDGELHFSKGFEEKIKIIK